MAETTSPIPSKKKEIKQMSFSEALLSVILGKKITKLEWDNSETYVYLAEGFLCIHNQGDETPHALLVKEEDLKGTDWIVINEKISN